MTSYLGYVASVRALFVQYPHFSVNFTLTPNGESVLSSIFSHKISNQWRLLSFHRTCHSFFSRAKQKASATACTRNLDRFIQSIRTLEISHYYDSSFGYTLFKVGPHKK
ncbi:unnamed protein product [Albugo candida]|uniref:Uncharacterized protein n=1 Tax=Albugo candida TaxID=65357 RepID=A0A024GM86_9STRA|nr:unnamed protein product [Albugo candida]|eukprot:CCI47976.1 unnamed protein product [Albugo candida]